jgi:hypothetical protein
MLIDSHEAAMQLVITTKSGSEGLVVEVYEM